MSKRLCCFMPDQSDLKSRCERTAEWEVIASNMPLEISTDACTEHLGALLDDSEKHEVYPLKEAT